MTRSYQLKPDLAMIFTADRSHYPSNDLDLGPIMVESDNH